MGTDTLVEDIYSLLSTKETSDEIDIEKNIELFGESVKELMRNQFLVDRNKDKRKLRMSLIGRPDKYIWNKYHETPSEELQPYTLLKFMYGHLIEEMLLFLTRMSGHKVTDEQKRCEVRGVQGSMDCKIDGVLTDVKSASVFGFKKFKDRKVAEDDPFGYIGQIKAYAYSENETEFGWLAMDKQNGHITYLKHDLKDKKDPMYENLQGDIAEQIEHIKRVVSKSEPKEFCYEDVPEGKLGNRKLAIGCSYCEFKHHCYPNLRVFNYARGPVFLTKVVKEPKVQEQNFKVLASEF
tara:strand:- start:10208 stop:11089 length:882 start_codon:yes stop_codon:yes gene_type:complete